MGSTISGSLRDILTIFFSYATRQPPVTLRLNSQLILIHQPYKPPPSFKILAPPLCLDAVARRTWGSAISDILGINNQIFGAPRQPIVALCLDSH